VNRQVWIKAEQIARMVVKGIPYTRIAVEMGMSYDGLIRITRQPEYLRVEESVRAQVTGKMDARLAKRAEMEDQLEDAIPEAMKVLLDSVTKKRDLRAALELMDRDPQRQFAKGNQSQRPTASQPTLPQDILQSTVMAADIARDQITRLAPDVAQKSTTDLSELN
jgi:hypothetical protein